MHTTSRVAMDDERGRDVPFVQRPAQSAAVSKLPPTCLSSSAATSASSCRSSAMSTASSLGRSVCLCPGRYPCLHVGSGRSGATRVQCMSSSAVCIGRECALLPAPGPHVATSAAEPIFSRGRAADGGALPLRHSFGFANQFVPVIHWYSTL